MSRLEINQIQMNPISQPTDIIPVTRPVIYTPENLEEQDSKKQVVQEMNVISVNSVGNVEEQQEPPKPKNKKTEIPESQVVESSPGTGMSARQETLHQVKNIARSITVFIETQFKHTTTTEAVNIYQDCREYLTIDINNSNKIEAFKKLLEKHIRILNVRTEAATTAGKKQLSEDAQLHIQLQLLELLKSQLMALDYLISTISLEEKGSINPQLEIKQDDYEELDVEKINEAMNPKPSPDTTKPKAFIEDSKKNQRGLFGWFSRKNKKDVEKSMSLPQKKDNKQIPEKEKSTTSVDPGVIEELSKKENPTSLPNFVTIRRCKNNGNMPHVRQSLMQNPTVIPIRKVSILGDDAQIFDFSKLVAPGEQFSSTALPYVSGTFKNQLFKIFGSIGSTRFREITTSYYHGADVVLILNNNNSNWLANFMANEDMQIYIPSYESNASVRLVPLNSVKSMTEIEDPEDLTQKNCESYASNLLSACAEVMASAPLSSHTVSSSRTQTQKPSDTGFYF